MALGRGLPALLILVASSGSALSEDQVRYLERPFDRTSADDFRVTRFTYTWATMWREGGPPR